MTRHQVVIQFIIFIYSLLFISRAVNRRISFHFSISSLLTIIILSMEITYSITNYKLLLLYLLLYQCLLLWLISIWVLRYIIITSSQFKMDIVAKYVFHCVYAICIIISLLQAIIEWLNIIGVFCYYCTLSQLSELGR